MQPNNSSNVLQAPRVLEDSGNCPFELILENHAYAQFYFDHALTYLMK